MNPMPPKEFFTWLDDLLRNKGWSDRQLAVAAGISPTVLSKARNNLQGIGWDASVAIAQALQVPPEVVLRKVGLLPKASGAPLDTDELIAVFRELNEEDQKELLQIGRLKVSKYRGKQSRK